MDEIIEAIQGHIQSLGYDAKRTELDWDHRQLNNYKPKKTCLYIYNSPTDTLTSCLLTIKFRQDRVTISTNYSIPYDIDLADPSILEQIKGALESGRSLMISHDRKLYWTAAILILTICVILSAVLIYMMA